MLYGHRGREAHLRAVFDVVSFVEAEVTKVVWRRPFAGSACLWGQGQVGEVVRQGAQAIRDVVEGAVRRGALEEVVVQCLREGEEKSHSGSDGRLQNAKKYLILGGKCCNMRHLISILSPALIVSSRREYAQRLESRLEAKEHVFLIIPSKKKKKVSQISLRSFQM